MKTNAGRAYTDAEEMKMDATYGGLKTRRWAQRRAALLGCALLWTGCVIPCFAGASDQPSFQSPDEAGRALLAAVHDRDEPRVRQILAGGRELLGVDGQTEEQLERELFESKYQEMHRWARISDGVRMLYVGAENWPFPVPLISLGGRWRFDARAGSEEILFRRIGANEVTAIGMCATLAAAVLHPGADSEADRVVNDLLPRLHEAGGPIPLHGYYFRILNDSAGAFGAIAYPVAYRFSGVETFIVTADGTVLEKDLGPDTPKIAVATTTARVDSTWTAASKSE